MHKPAPQSTHAQRLCALQLQALQVSSAWRSTVHACRTKRAQIQGCCSTTTSQKRRDLPACVPALLTACNAAVYASSHNAGRVCLVHNLPPSSYTPANTNPKTLLLLVHSQQGTASTNACPRMCRRLCPLVTCLLRSNTVKRGQVSLPQVIVDTEESSRANHGTCCTADKLPTRCCRRWQWQQHSACTPLAAAWLHVRVLRAACVSCRHRQRSEAAQADSLMCALHTLPPAATDGPAKCLQASRWR